jgi:ArsR family transcriptional regulator, virulence genes transcriptional regulator
MNMTMFDMAEKQAAVCKVLGNTRRLLILWQLSKEELSVNEIATRVGSTLQNVSQHLSLLKRSGIVVTRREGQSIYYQLADHEGVINCLARHSFAQDELLQERSGAAPERVDIQTNT